jgi:hypothetical protein
MEQTDKTPSELLFNQDEIAMISEQGNAYEDAVAYVKKLSEQLKGSGWGAGEHMFGKAERGDDTEFLTFAEETAIQLIMAVAVARLRRCKRGAK